MKNGKLLIAPSMLWLGFFFIIPMLIVVAVSFAARTPYGQVVFNWNINNYLRFLEPLYLSIFAQTLIVALVTTVVTILMGYPLAYYIAQLPKRWQQPGLILCMIPFWINFLIRSYAWVIILRAQGVLNTFLMKAGFIEQPLQLLYNEGAVMLGMIYSLLPFMILPIYFRSGSRSFHRFPEDYPAPDHARRGGRHHSGVHLFLGHVRGTGRNGWRQVRPGGEPDPEPVPLRP